MLEGSGADLLANDEVRKAYLGEECAAAGRSCRTGAVEQPPLKERALWALVGDLPAK